VAVTEALDLKDASFRRSLNADRDETEQQREK
jgi:hypothetical protein